MFYFINRTFLSLLLPLLLPLEEASELEVLAKEPK